jgi:hypothetical protein
MTDERITDEELAELVRDTEEAPRPGCAGTWTATWR